MTSGLDLFNLDVTAINSLDDLAIDESNGEKKLIFQPKDRPHDSAQDPEIVQHVKQTLEKFKMEFGQKAEGLHNIELKSDNFQIYLQDAEALVKSADMTSAKIKNLWKICKTKNESYGQEIYVTAVNIVLSMQKEKSDYVLKKQLFKVFQSKRELGERFFKLQSQQKDEVNRVFQKIQEGKKVDDIDFETVTPKLLEITEGRLKNLVKELYGSSDSFVESNLASLWGLLIANKKENLIDRFFNLNFTNPSSWEYQRTNYKRDVLLGILSIYQAHQNSKDPHEMFTLIEEYLNEVDALFAKFTPDQLAPLYRLNDQSSVLYLNRMHPNIMQGLIDMKYDGRIVQDSMENGSSLLLNEPLMQLAKQLPVSYHQMLKVFLTEENPAQAETIKKMKPILEGCVDLINQGLPQDMIGSFLARAAVFLKSNISNASMLNKIPQNHLPSVIKAMQNIQYPALATRAEMIEALKKEGLEEALKEAGIIKTKDAAYTQKLLQDFYAARPDISGDFVPWFEKYLSISANPNLAQADFMAKLQSVDAEQLKVIRETIKKVRKLPPAQAREALALAQQFPWQIQRCLKLSEALKYDPALMPKFVEVAKISPRFALEELSNINIEKRAQIMTSGIDTDKFKIMSEVKEALDRENAGDLLESILPWFLEKMYPSSPDVFKDRDKLEGIRKIITIENEMGIKILSKFHENMLFIPKMLTQDPEFKKAFITILSSKEVPTLALQEGLKKHPEVVIKLTKIAATYPEAFTFLVDEVNTQSSGGSQDLVYPKLIDLFDQKASPKLINHMMVLIEEKREASLKGLLELWNDPRLDGAFRHEMVENLADRDRLLPPDVLEQSLKVFKDQSDTPLAKSLSVILRSPKQYGLIPVLLKIDPKMHSALLDRIASQRICDPLSTGALMMASRGNESMALLLERSFDAADQDPAVQRIRTIYPLLINRNYLAAEQMLKRESAPLEPRNPPRIVNPDTILKSLFDQYSVKESSGTLNIPDLREGGVFEEQPKKLHDTGAALALAEMLLMPSGEIDASLIPALRNSEVIKALNLDANTKKHIFHVLSVMEDDPEFSLRLKAATLPPDGSPGSRIIRQMLHVPSDVKLNPQHVRQVLLSALLAPTRQAAIGSCFATSLVIQQDSYPMGLKQKLEDLLALTAYGKITRSVWVENEKMSVSMDFPAFVEDLLNEPSLQNDHLLNRTREFTLSSFSAFNPEQHYVGLEKFLGDIILMLKRPMTNALDIPDDQLKENIVSKIEKNLKDEIRKQFGAAFIAGKKNPWPPHDLGAWALMDKTTGETINSVEDFERALMRAIDAVEPMISKEFPGQDKVIQNAFGDQNGLRNFLRSLSGEMKSVYFQLSEKNRLWVKYEAGGLPMNVAKIYFERHSTWKESSRLPLDHKQNLEAIIKYIDSLPEPLKQYNLDHPDFRVPLSYPGHALSLKPGPIIEKLNAGKTSDELAAEFIKSGDRWLDAPLSSDAKGRILQILNTETLKIPGIRFKHLFLDPGIRKFTTVRELLQALDNAMISMYGERPSTRKAVQDTILKKLMTEKSFSQDAPPFFEIGDTNWDSLYRYGFIPYSEKGGLSTAILDSDSSKASVQHFVMHDDSKGIWRTPYSWYLVDESNFKFTPLGEQP